MPNRPTRIPTAASAAAGRLSALRLSALLVAGLFAGAVLAAPGDQPVKPVPSATLGAKPPAALTRSASLPARGLFDGDKLSASARAQLSELVLDALSMDVEVALLVPTGPWQIDGGGHEDRDLNAARLQALRRFLTERGVDSKNIFVESRIDSRIKEPRLDVQLVGRPATD